MPTETLPAVQGPGHHHHRETMQRPTLFPTKNATEEPQGDRAGNARVADKSSNPEAELEETRITKVAVMPPELEDEELEEEMVNKQINMETEKRDSPKKVELRTVEDEERENQRFITEVMRLEARESGRKEAEETAKKKLTLDEQEWLKEALRMEEGASNPTPAPPPNLQAKVPSCRRSPTVSPTPRPSLAPPKPNPR